MSAATIPTPQPGDLNLCDVRDTTYDTPLPVYYEPVCAYCRQPNAEWTREALRYGSRVIGGVKQYHCYAAYVD